MFLQRPSVAKSQDVRHILARTFRDLYTRDTIGPDTVRNLNVSKGGDDPYHERYVENLQKVGSRILVCYGLKAYFFLLDLMLKICCIEIIGFMPLNNYKVII